MHIDRTKSFRKHSARIKMPNLNEVTHTVAGPIVCTISKYFSVLYPIECDPGNLLSLSKLMANVLKEIRFTPNSIC